MKKIIAIHNIVNPTRTAQFNKMSQIFATRGYQFKVLFLSESDKNRQWEVKKDFLFEYQVLKNRALTIAGKDVHTFFINPDISKVLDQENPDIIFCYGWDHLSAYVSNKWARKHHKKFILWSESTANEKSWRRTLFNPLVKYLLKRTEHSVVCGTRAKEYLVSLGAKPSSIQIFYNTVDIEDITHKINLMSQSDKDILRHKLGIKTNKVIYYCGQLIERKGVYELLEGFRLYQQKEKEGRDLTLLMVGQGREMSNLKSIIKERKIENVIFTGFVQYEEVFKFYAISDLFILPSHEEVWGLVLNEAVAAGLPVISTNVTGGAPDLIKNGQNGYIIEPKSAPAIKDAIHKVFLNGLDKNNSSKEIIKKFLLDTMIKGIEL